MLIKIIKIILIIFILSHCFFNKIFYAISLTNLKFEKKIDLKKKKLKSILEKIDDKDKSSIDKLFRHLIASQLIGYVIFGDKPIVWGDLYSKKYYVNLKDKKKLFYYDSTWDDYLIWKKCKQLSTKVESFMVHKACPH